MSEKYKIKDCEWGNLGKLKMLQGIANELAELNIHLKNLVTLQHGYRTTKLDKLIKK